MLDRIGRRLTSSVPSPVHIASELLCGNRTEELLVFSTEMSPLACDATIQGPELRIAVTCLRARFIYRYFEITFASIRDDSRNEILRASNSDSDEKCTITLQVFIRSIVSTTRSLEWISLILMLFVKVIIVLPRVLFVWSTPIFILQIHHASPCLTIYILCIPATSRFNSCRALTTYTDLVEHAVARVWQTSSASASRLKLLMERHAR